MRKKFTALLLSAALLAGSVCGNVSAEEKITDADCAVEEIQTVSETGTGLTLEEQTVSEADTAQTPFYEMTESEGVSSEAPEIALQDKNISEKQQDEADFSVQESARAAMDADIRQYAADAAGENSVPQNMTDITFDYKNACDIMTQYVTKDEKTAKLLNNNVLYSYDIAADQVTVEYTFPVSGYLSGGIYYGAQDEISTFIREDAGLLYYGYNSYCNTFSADEVMNVVVYDLEKGEVVRTVEISGYILDSVGADRAGNIYIATDDASEQNDQLVSAYALLVLSETGSKICEKQLTYPLDSFSGFCTDGTFYYIDEYMAYSQLGYANLMGRLMQGSFQNNTVTLNENYMDYVKNIYFANYRTPVEIINDEYLVTFTGGFYPLSSITDSSWSQSLYTPRDLEMGGVYDYIYNAGVNAVLVGDDVYSLYDNDTIFVYSMASGQKKKIYNASAKIFNMKKCGDGLLALETDGTHFFYEMIPLSGMTEIKTQTYNMNDFSVYKGRTKADIVKKFMAAAPADMDASLYDQTGSAKKPYKASTLTAKTKKYALNVSGYYRWLAGLTTFESAADTTWTNAAKGAVLLSASEFSHTPAKPSDMGTTFYNAAYEGTSNSNIAMNYSDKQYKIVDSIRLFMNDTGDVIPLHRTNFLTRNATDIAYGIYGPYLCQTVGYTGNPNPLGTAVKDNNEAAYAWPAAGYFPAEDLSPSAYWTVNLNTDKLNLSNVALQVTITDLDTGKTYKRTSSADGLYAADFWGKYISFAPPALNKSSYSNKNYKVTLKNLSDADGMPAILEYTIHFFSYSDGGKQNGTLYQCDSYGQSVKPGTPVISVSNTASGVKVSWKKAAGADGYYVYRNGKQIKKTTAISFTDKSAKNGTKYKYKVVAYKGKVKGAASKVKTCYFVSRPAISSVKKQSGGKLTVKWKANQKASGYQIKYVQGKKSATVTVSGGKKTSQTLKSLKKGKTYTLYIRACKKSGKTKYYSAWSKARKVKTLK